MSTQILITCEEMLSLRQAWDGDQLNVAFVPTMGALHDGHLNLVKAARSNGADRIVVSIFVNPMQFGPKEDYARYPRTMSADKELLESLGVEALFTPNLNEIYGEKFQTSVDNFRMSHILCGASRPGHFCGVLTIVLKLFQLVRPQSAFFGKKDYQQFRLIEAMVRDFQIPIEVVGVETVREADGLAMSSRNRYLQPEEREAAALIYKGLSAAHKAWSEGQRTSEVLVKTISEAMTSSPIIQPEYIEIRQQLELDKSFPDQIDSPAVALIAAKIGQTRLIDNIELS